MKKVSENEMEKDTLQSEFYLHHSLQNEIKDCLSDFTLQRWCDKTESSK
jgi:hypothetical protein